MENNVDWILFEKNDKEKKNIAKIEKVREKILCANCRRVPVNRDEEARMHSWSLVDASK